MDWSKIYGFIEPKQIIAVSDIDLEGSFWFRRRLAQLSEDRKLRKTTKRKFLVELFAIFLSNSKNTFRDRGAKTNDDLFRFLFMRGWSTMGSFLSVLLQLVSMLKSARRFSLYKESAVCLLKFSLRPQIAVLTTKVRKSFDLWKISTKILAN